MPPTCAEGCAQQLPLFATRPDPSMQPSEFDWDAQDFVIVGTSAGKDSEVLVDEVCHQADAAGQLHKVRVLHCDLGKTPEGHDVEWPGVVDLASRQTALYGVPFAVRRSTRWSSLFKRILDHGKFPGHFARYCTSDLKTAVGRDYIDELARGARLSRPVRAGYALGMRAEESGARAKKPVIERHRMSGKGTKRIVTTWLPLHQRTEAEVWQTIRDRRLPYHDAYDQGMRRLSCRFCPLAANEDLIRSAQLNPDLAQEYARAEASMEGPFKKNVSMAQIIEHARQQH